MDRQIVYPAQIPLDSDLLNAQRNAFVGLGHLAGMAYGENTVSAGGFACTPGAGLTVTIAPGSLLAAGVVDTTAYGTLAASGSVLVRQYISRDPVTLTVPGAGGTYTVYATPATVDTDDTVLPFYNAADPSVTYAGADNSGKAAPTVRQDVAQLGIGAAVPDGAYPLWSVTAPAATTAIAADMIAQAEGAPFYETIPGLQASKISKAGDGMAGPLSVLNATAAQNPVALGQLQAMGFIANALIGVTSITSSGTFTPDARTKWLRIRGVGGGGGSGGCPYTGSTQESTASGGYSGGYIELVVSVEDLLAGADSIAISIGAGGLAGTGNASGATPGGDGGDTTIGGAVTIPGGPGGHNGSWEYRIAGVLSGAINYIADLYGRHHYSRHTPNNLEKRPDRAWHWHQSAEGRRRRRYPFRAGRHRRRIPRRRDW
ncbi:hypothetical protein RI056_15060 [Komagataeibacter nataicola]|uniref:glycine-rich domain-containing protein n=1 Tax=Komagataeibacter nataicola TaxID=265960 RepID=UPI0028A956D3|nr:hypothetical protein [Komagataeibacter nataicola]WNM08196.1 hypothetical protein RI056_15060 [Komagataeibacter nataicola]